jgi:hypothetical protein
LKGLDDMVFDKSKGLLSIPRVIYIQ